MIFIVEALLVVEEALPDLQARGVSISILSLLIVLRPIKLSNNRSFIEARLIKLRKKFNFPAWNVFLSPVHTMRFVSYGCLCYYAEMTEIIYESMNLKGVVHN